MARKKKVEKVELPHAPAVNQPITETIEKKLYALCNECYSFKSNS